jgi:hypothetical protein
MEEKRVQTAWEHVASIVCQQTEKRVRVYQQAPGFRPGPRGQYVPRPTVSAPSAAGTSPVKPFAERLSCITRPACVPPASPKVTPVHAVTGVLSSHSQGLTLTHFTAQLEDLREHIAHVRAQLEHFRDTPTG